HAPAALPTSPTHVNISTTVTSANPNCDTSIPSSDATSAPSTWRGSPLTRSETVILFFVAIHLTSSTVIGPFGNSFCATARGGQRVLNLSVESYLVLNIIFAMSIASTLGNASSTR